MEQWLAGRNVTNGCKMAACDLSFAVTMTVECDRVYMLCVSLKRQKIKRLCEHLTLAQWRNCNFWAPGKHSVHSLITVFVKMLRRPFIFWLYTCKI